MPTDIVCLYRRNAILFETPEYKGVTLLKLARTFGCVKQL
jgi:hypothetical protein